MDLYRLYLSTYVEKDEQVIQDIRLYELNQDIDKESKIRNCIKRLNCIHGVDSTDIKFSFNILHQIIETRRLNVFKALFREYSKDIKYKDEFNRTYLHLLTHVQAYYYTLYFLSDNHTTYFLQENIRRAEHLQLCSFVEIAIIKESFNGTRMYNDNER